MEDRIRVTSLMLASVPRGTRLVLLGGRSQESGHQVVGFGGKTETGTGETRSPCLGCLGPLQEYNRRRLEGTGRLPCALRCDRPEQPTAGRTNRGERRSPRHKARFGPRPQGVAAAPAGPSRPRRAAGG